MGVQGGQVWLDRVDCLVRVILAVRWVRVVRLVREVREVRLGLLITT